MWRYKTDWNRVKKAAWENTQHQEGPDPAQPIPLLCYCLLQIGKALQELGSAQENSWRNCSAGKSAWCSIHFIHPSIPKENGVPTKPFGLASRDGLTQPISMCSMKHRDQTDGVWKKVHLFQVPGLQPVDGIHTLSYAYICYHVLSGLNCLGKHKKNIFHIKMKVNGKYSP